MAPRFFTFGSPSVVAEGERTHTKRQSHTDTIHKQQVRYGTSACLRLVSMARTRSPVLGASIPLTGRGGAELSLRRSHGRSVALWRVAAGDGAATRHGHRHESTARDLGQEDAYSTFWSDTDRNRLTGHSRPRQSISKCAREIGRTVHSQ